MQPHSFFIGSIFFAGGRTPNSHYIVLLHVYVKLPTQLDGNMVIDYFHSASLNILAMGFTLLIISEFKMTKYIYFS